MTTNQVLFGIALTLVLAVGSQVLASRIRVPVLIILLPVGFVGGMLTSDINPVPLLGHSFQPMVSLGVAVILYDASMSVDLGRLTSQTRRIVGRLLAVSIPVTMVLGAAAAAALLGMSWRAAVMTGAILVASGATAMGPLLGFVRPAERLRQVLWFEGALMAPVGGILGVVIFSAVEASSARGLAAQAAAFGARIGIGVAGGIVGTALLYLALRKLALVRAMASSAQLAVVFGVVAGCDLLRADTGLLAAILMGVALASLKGFDLPARRPFLETLVQVITGILLLAISATVTGAEVRQLVLPALALTAVLVLVARPLIVLIATRGTDLTRREREFVGWMAPRGMVAAAGAASFAGPLAARGITGASKIWAVTFLVIVVTILLYGLTAIPAARLLGVLRSARSQPLLVGGDDWVIDLGRALQVAGVDVLMWAGLEVQREQIRQASLRLAPGELLASVTADRAELTGVTSVLLLTAEDDFNALATSVLRDAVGNRVFRLGPSPGNRGVVAPFTGGDVLFGHDLNRSALVSRYEDGDRITTWRAGADLPPGHQLLFLVHADGRLDPATRERQLAPREGDTLVLLSSAAR